MGHEATEWSLRQSEHPGMVSSLRWSASPGHPPLGASSPSYLPGAQAQGLLTYLHGTDNSTLEVRIQQVWSGRQRNTVREEGQNWTSRVCLSVCLTHTPSSTLNPTLSSDPSGSIGITLTHPTSKAIPLHSYTSQDSLPSGTPSQRHGGPPHHLP